MIGIFTDLATFLANLANDINQEGDGKHEIKTIVSRPAIIN